MRMLSGKEKRDKEAEVWEMIRPALDIGSKPEDMARYMVARRLVVKKTSDPAFVSAFNEQKMNFKQFLFHNFTYEEILRVMNMDMRDCVRKKE